MLSLRKPKPLLLRSAESLGARLLLCNSLPKSGSTWAFFCLKDALSRLGAEDVFTSGAAHMVNAWGNPSGLTSERIDALLAVSRPVLIKSHVAPSAYLEEHLQQGRARVAYLIRHPLDIVASTLDYGIKTREQGEESAPYFHIHTLDDALAFLAPFWEAALAWQALGENSAVLLCRYEDFLADKAAYLCRIIRHYLPELADDAISQAVHEALALYDTERQKTWVAPQSKDHLRFNKGGAERYIKYFDAAALQVLASQLTPICTQLGYAIRSA